MQPFRRWFVLSGLLVGFAAGCAAPESEPASDRASQPGDDEPLGTTSEAISVNDVMERADEWVALGVPYCGGVNGGTDYICGGTCNRPHADWDDFRTDCSGFVSWCWQIPSDPTTSSYMNDHSGDNGWHTIDIDDLTTGDAVVCDGHIKLWNEFKSAGSAEIYEEYNCGHVARKAVQSFTRSGNTMHFSGDSRTYHPIRRNGIEPLATMAGYLDSADVMTKGWAADMNATDATIAVDLYFGGDKGDGYGVELTANEPRPDVAEALGIDPNHGYEVLTPFYYCDGKEHQVFAYGQAAADGSPIALKDSPKTFTCPIGKSPDGDLRHVVSPDSMTAWKLDKRSELAWMTPEDHATHAEKADWPTAPKLGKTPDGAVWVVDGGSRRHVLSPASLAAWAFDASTIATWGTNELAQYPLGADLPERPILLQEPGQPAIYVLDAQPSDVTTGVGVGSGAGPGATGGGAGTGGDASGDSLANDQGGCSVSGADASRDASSLSWMAIAVGVVCAARRRSASR